MLGGSQKRKSSNSSSATNKGAHRRSKSGLSMLSVPSGDSDSSVDSQLRSNSLSSLEIHGRPTWHRSKSFDAVNNKSVPGSSLFKSKGSTPLSKNRMKSKGNKMYNMNGISQSLDELPIMEDDESEAVLNVPVLPQFRQNELKDAAKPTTASLRKTLFSLGDEEDPESSSDKPPSDDEKNEIDKDFDVNWGLYDIGKQTLKRKPQATERKSRVLLSEESSSDDDDASTEQEESSNSPEKYTKDANSYSIKSDNQSLTSSTRSRKHKSIKDIFRSRSRSVHSKKEEDLELGNIEADEKLYRSITEASSARNEGLLNKIFHLDGFLNGGGLTPSVNVDANHEHYNGVEEEKKNADLIVKQAMGGLQFKKHEPEPPTFQLGRNMSNPNSETNLATSTGYGNNIDSTRNRKQLNDSALYIPTGLQENEFDDLHNFEEYSSDLPSLLDGERKTRAGIGTLLMKLNKPETNTTFNSSFVTHNTYSEGNSETDLTDQATHNLEDILSTKDFELKNHNNELDDFMEFDKVTNAIDSSTDLVSHKTQSFLKNVTSKPASIRNFISGEPRRKKQHQRQKSNSSKSSFDLPDFYFKQQQQQKNTDQMMKKKIFKRRKENVARITVHIADLLGRQRFILLLCKAFMLYGAPTHRLEEYMFMTASVLEVDGSFVYIPGCMIVSFGDAALRTSEMRLVRCSQGLDLSKLDDVHEVYKGVVHDRLGVDDGCQILNDIMTRKPKFNKWLCTLFYAICSASVCPWGFGGSWIDMPVSFGVGAVIGAFQFVICPLNTLYSSVFEVSSSIIASFLARAIGSINGGNTFCYASIVQSSLALILPGYIILCGSLELQSRNLVAGSVRMFYAFIYSLMLSFGITLGAALYGWIDNEATSNTTCTSNVSPWFRFLFVPAFTMGIALCNQASWKQLPMMIVISGSGYVVTYFSSLHFKNVTELNATLGCFMIGLVANIYSRIHKTIQKKVKLSVLGTSMTVSLMLPGIFVLVPSGIASQGSVLMGIATANDIVSSSTTVTTESSSLSFGMTMIQVALGISVGLYLSTILVYPFGKKKTGLFTL